MLSSFGLSIPASISTVLSSYSQYPNCQTDSVIQFAPILQFRRFGVMFRPKPNLCYSNFAVAETVC